MVTLVTKVVMIVRKSLGNCMFLPSLTKFEYILLQSTVYTRQLNISFSFTTWLTRLHVSAVLYGHRQAYIIILFCRPDDGRIKRPKHVACNTTTDIQLLRIDGTLQ